MSAARATPTAPPGTVAVDDVPPAGWTGPAAVRPAGAGPGPEALTEEQLASQLALLVQSLADVLPDDVVCFARAALVRGAPADVVEAVTFALLHRRSPATDVEVAVLAECLQASGRDPAAVHDLVVAPGPRWLAYQVVAHPELRAWAAAGPGADEPAPSEQVRATDAAVLSAVVTDGVLGVWRAWRYPVIDVVWPPPRPLYLVEVASQAAHDSVLAGVYGRQQLCLGPEDPLVEVQVAGGELPALQRSVQLAGDLLHQVGQDAPFRFADVFEGDPSSDGSPPRVERLEQAEADRHLAYLLSGSLLMLAESAADDVLDPQRGPVVPLHLRTDGTWIWSEATAYYLAKHAVAPVAPLRAWLDEQQGAAPAVADVRRHQAVAWLHDG